jgi:hypothetical protein
MIRIKHVVEYTDDKVSRNEYRLERTQGMADQYVDYIATLSPGEVKELKECLNKISI